MLFVITTFSLFYFTYLHNFLYVYEFTTETGGLPFPRAIYQTMTGLYFAELCLAGLFFLTSGARAQGIVMIVILLLTIIFHIQLQKTFDPLITYLPIDIQEALMSKIHEQKAEEGRNSQDEEEFRAQKDMPREPQQDLSQIPEHPGEGRREAIPAEPSFIPKMEFEKEEDDADEKVEDGNTNLKGRPSLKTRIKGIRIPGVMKKKQFYDDDDDVSPITGITRKHIRDLTHEELTEIAFQHEALRA